ncbi:hypothetical protein M3Y94_00323000 [Aphelenchoides besseyi]|nr:hypothetical protein M3Y94_00323000 [Aphelenchoides besseyi]KAI6235620.1 hypothetical protein M3Y95_00070900 [Aphelenchoides besseyi]
MTAEATKQKPSVPRNSGVKFVPWEPKKKESKPKTLNFRQNLVPYEFDGNLPERCRPDNLLHELNSLVEHPFQPKNQLGHSHHKKTRDLNDEPQTELLLTQLRTLQHELDDARKVNRELKTLFVSAFGEDLDCKVSSMAEDKVRLARNIDSYYNKIRTDAETQDQLSIENNLWRSKFLAISIRADDLSYSLHQSLRLFKQAQNLLARLRDKVYDQSSDLQTDICNLLNVDVLSLYNRTPCNERPQSIHSFTSNITITCCKRCADKEILLV